MRNGTTTAPLPSALTKRRGRPPKARPWEDDTGEVPPTKIDIKEKIAKPTKEKTAAIFIPKIAVNHTTIKVIGISSLIVHAWSEKAKKEMRDKQTGVATQKREFKVPMDDFNGARYLNAEGKDCVPALAFRNAAVEAGVLAGVFKTTLRKAFFITGPDLIPIISDPPIMREDMVRVGQGTADLRYRPEYKNWSCVVPVEFNPKVLSLEQLVNLFDNAGYAIGICEWRPQRDGQFGRFRVAIDSTK